jgi:hypothetical protein
LATTIFGLEYYITIGISLPVNFNENSTSIFLERNILFQEFFFEKKKSDNFFDKTFSFEKRIHHIWTHFLKFGAVFHQRYNIYTDHVVLTLYIQTRPVLECILHGLYMEGVE